MKKLTAISVIVLGVTLLSFSTFIIIDNTMSIENAKRIAEISGNTSFEQSLHHSRALAIALFCISSFVIAGGYRLRKMAIAVA